MAQLGSTNVYGALGVTDNISEGGTLLSNKYLGISAKAASASSADAVAWSGVTNKTSETLTFTLSNNTTSSITVATV